MLRKRSLVFLALIVGLTGCWAKTKQIREIVAATNAAMVSPYLPKPMGQEPSGWQDAIRAIDQMIAANSDQPVLVNHLRVRAAMLLTVNKKSNLAELRWEAVDSTRLNERDRAFHAVWQYLVWWYPRAGETSPDLGDPGRDSVDTAVNLIDGALNAVAVREVQLLLETIRAQMLMRKLNSIDVGDTVQARVVTDGLASALDRYVSAFLDDDRNWVPKNANTDLVDDDMAIDDFRYRIWLREMIKEYVRVAGVQCVTPAWKQTWINVSFPINRDSTCP